MAKSSPELVMLHDMAMNLMTTRQKFLDNVLDGNRDLNKECGYPNEITPLDYYQMYRREGIANRVVSVLPKESWAMDPTVKENEESDETAFENRWNALLEKHNFWHWLEKADILSGIGYYGGLLIGVKDGKTLNEPAFEVDEIGELVTVSGGEVDILYLRALGQNQLIPVDYDNNTRSPRFGKPIHYTVTTGDPTGVSGTNFSNTNVHWTRILPLVDNTESSLVFGRPRQEPVYNRLIDLRKTYGGAAEMLWKGGFPGLSFELDPTMASEGLPIDRESLRKELEAYQNGLQRFLAVVGLRTKSLDVQVADPSKHIEVMLDAICITLGIPKRVFMGSEEASLASSQDQRTWNKRLMRRQAKYLTPMVVRPFVKLLMAMRVLPTVEKFLIQWPDLNLPTDRDRAEVAEILTRAAGDYTSKEVSLLMDPEDYFVEVWKMEREKAAEIAKNNAEGIKKLQDPDKLNTGPDFGIPGGNGFDRREVGGGGPGRSEPKPRQSRSTTSG